MAEKEYYNMTDLSTKFGVSKRTITRWVEGGRLPKPDIGGDGRILLWHIESFEEYLKKHNFYPTFYEKNQ